MLVERESSLRTLQGLPGAATARGHLAWFAADGGHRQDQPAARRRGGPSRGRRPVWWGACDALQTPHPLAPLLDMAREADAALRRPARPARARRCSRPCSTTCGWPRPLLVVVEDAHWADDATLDLLKYLGRRIERTQRAAGRQLPRRRGRRHAPAAPRAGRAAAGAAHAPAAAAPERRPRWTRWRARPAARRTACTRDRRQRLLRDRTAARRPDAGPACRAACRTWCWRATRGLPRARRRWCAWSRWCRGAPSAGWSTRCCARRRWHDLDIAPLSGLLWPTRRRSASATSWGASRSSRRCRRRRRSALHGRCWRRCRSTSGRHAARRGWSTTRCRRRRPGGLHAGWARGGRRRPPARRAPRGARALVRRAAGRPVRSTTPRELAALAGGLRHHRPRRSAASTMTCRPGERERLAERSGDTAAAAWHRASRARLHVPCCATATAERAGRRGHCDGRDAAARRRQGRVLRVEAWLLHDRARPRGEPAHCPHRPGAGGSRRATATPGRVRSAQHGRRRCCSSTSSGAIASDRGGWPRWRAPRQMPPLVANR